MITKTTTRYTSHYKASQRYMLPTALVVTDYTTTKIHFDCDDKFQHALGFLNRRSRVMNNHPVRPTYFPIAGFDKIKVNLRNKKIYLVKRSYRKRFDIIV